MSGRAAHTIRDRAAIVGIGHTSYTTGSGVTEHRQAVEAIRAALDDAGLTVKDVDGVARFDIENVNELALLYSMGIPHLRFFAGVTSGGGAVCGTLVLAAMAVATGQADVVVCYRARNRGKRSSHGAKPLHGGRPWAKQPAAQTDLYQYHVPFGLVTPAQEMAMIYRRHMHEFGTSTEHFGNVAVAQRAHAARNPHAVMRAADHAGRPSGLALDRRAAAPARLLPGDRRRLRGDRHLSRARARLPAAAGLHPRRRTGRGADPHPDGRLPDLLADATRPGTTSPSSSTGWLACGRRTSMRRCSSTTSARRSFSASRTTDSAPRGGGGAFVAAGEHAWPHGSLPVNTHGGSLSEAYIHGYNHIIEGVRQVRGDVGLPGGGRGAGAGDELEHRPDRGGDPQTLNDRKDSKDLQVLI